MIYQSGDYVYPADLPRPLLCRVDTHVDAFGLQALGISAASTRVPGGSGFGSISTCLPEMRVR